ncbi:MAG: response regulator [Sphingobacteriales bacterium]|jgi:DNA-binding LytR/AlgR family response regulator|nr:response regulator [Sphingobacteriales bacterium]
MKKILIVEDEFIIAYRIKELLEKKEIGQCEIRDTYQESVDWLSIELPDLVLLDIRLFDDEDAGIRIAHYIQEHYHIPFIFFSGYSDEATLKTARLYKPATFITKPVIEEQLLAAIKIAMPDYGICKIKTVFFKGKYFENTPFEQLMKAHFSEYDFINKEIKFDHINIIQSFNHIKRNTIVFKFQQPHTFFIMGTTIEKILAQLPSYFRQVHQSFIVNTQKISAIRKDHYITITNEDVPIGNAFKKALK